MDEAEFRDGYGEIAPRLRSYLYKTARRLIADQRRSRARERRHREVMSVEPPEAPRLDLGLEMERALAELPSQQRALLWLAYVEGFGHRDIAKPLGLREGSVRVLLYRARKKLGGLLEGSGWGPEEGEGRSRKICVDMNRRWFRLFGPASGERALLPISPRVRRAKNRGTSLAGCESLLTPLLRLDLP